MDSNRDDQSAATPHESDESAYAALVWSLAGLVLLGVALVQLFGPVWREGPSRVVPTPPAVAELRTADPDRIDMLAADSRFNVWATAHGAHALTHEPSAVFDGEQCHPATRTLAYGHPLLSYAVLGLPAQLASGDPILTYNVGLLASIALGVFAMYLLVRDWTGLTSAGVGAGLIYGLYASKIGPINWPFIPETGWSVLALWLVHRFAAKRRWLDAVGAATCCVLQLTVSFYPVLSAVFLALPLLVWLVVAYGTRPLRTPAAGIALAILFLGSWAIFGPYLEVRAEFDTLKSEVQLFAPWSSLLPGRVVGWTALALAIVALALPRRLSLPRLGGDPRWALLVAIGLLAWLGTGGRGATNIPLPSGPSSGSPLPNLFGALASMIPGLDTVRSPGTLLNGIHLASSILAGLGIAALVRSVPARFATVVAIALVGGVWIAILRPPLLGLEPRVHYETLTLRPDEATLAFFATLEAAGNDGPLLELPMNARRNRRELMRDSERVLHSAYHHRRTSACYNSFAPPSYVAVAGLARKLPDATAIGTLREMGFTTILFHRLVPGRASPAERRMRDAQPPLVMVHETPELAAYALGASDS